MKMKPVFWMLVFGILVSCTNPSGEKSQVITIGVNLTLSGKAAEWGVNLKNGLQLAFSVYNDTCRKNALKVIYEDNSFSARQAVSITHKFIDVNKTDIIISGYTPIVKATRDIVNEASIPMMATLSSSGDVTGDMKWVFRDFVMESKCMPMLADYAYKDAEYRKGSSLVVNDDFGTDAAKFFRKAFNSLGGKMTGGEVFEAGEMDHRTKIAKILTDDPEFVLVIGRGAAMINAIRQLKESDPDLCIITTESINYRKIWKGLGKAAEGLVFTEVEVDKETEAFHKINTRSREIYGRSLNWVSIYGYTIGKYLADIVYRHGNDKIAIRDALLDLDVQSIRGRLLMDGNREVITPLVVKKRIGKENVSIQ